jgi:hypothetical protein
MNPLPLRESKFKLCALVSLAMVILSLIPQIHLWIVRGREWNGTYVQIQGDEPLYAAYINSLIDGRTRRNDPYGARDDGPASHLPESTFSIQFIPPYVIAFFARIAGASASTAMIALIGLAGLFASIAVFWLLDSITDDYRLAAAGTLFVLCLGGMAGGHALLGLLLKSADLSMPSLPFLRRYQPAAAFPLVFVFVVLVWRRLTDNRTRVAQVSAILAGITLAVLVFCYLFLWTAVLAWLICIIALWFVFRSSERLKAIVMLAVIGIIAGVALAPYAYLVSHRSPSLDEQQTLASTHRPELFHIPEIIGVLILIALVIGIRHRRIELNAPRTLFAISLGLLPLLVFNQQIITGKTMQSFHFDAFIVNYLVLVGLLITITLWLKPIPSRALVWLGALFFAWGVVEVGLPSRLTTVPAAVVNDQIVPVLLRLKQLSKEDGTLADLRAKGSASTIVFSPQLVETALQPAWTSQPALLDLGGLDFSSVTREERKEYFFMHLYYSNANIEELRKALKGMPEDPAMNYYARAVIFGHERIVPALAVNFKPIQDEEVEDAIRAYQAYANSFSRAQAAKRPLTYVVTAADSKFDFKNIDRWYVRASAEWVGAYMLYRVKLRD